MGMEKAPQWGTSYFCIVRMIKSRRLRWGENVARMEEGRSSFKMLTGKPTGKRVLRHLGVDEKAILEWI